MTSSRADSAHRSHLALTRTTQEALVNTAKHALHQPVRIKPDYQPGCTTLSVANPFRGAGPGYPALETANGGYGLADLQERLLLINGTLTAGPDDGDWVVTARVPR